MSETNSFKPLEQTSDEGHLVDRPTLAATEARGFALVEYLGAGGMGEVYRYGSSRIHAALLAHGSWPSTASCAA